MDGQTEGCTDELLADAESVCAVPVCAYVCVYVCVSETKSCPFMHLSLHFSTLGVACLAHLEMHGQKHRETQTEKNAFSSSQWQEDENTDKDAHHTVDAVIVTNATP